MTEFGAHPQARPGAGRRVLVTGAAGRIGRAACPGLAARGWRVRGLDARPLDGVAGLDDPPVVAELGDTAALAGRPPGWTRSCTWPACRPRPRSRTSSGPTSTGRTRSSRPPAAPAVPRVVFASSNHAVGFTPR